MPRAACRGVPRAHGEDIGGYPRAHGEDIGGYRGRSMHAIACRINACPCRVNPRYRGSSMDMEDHAIACRVPLEIASNFCSVYLEIRHLVGRRF